MVAALAECPGPLAVISADTAISIMGVNAKQELVEMCIRDSFGSMHPSGTPIWSFMFITVACGAISGFHSTQSPLMARCMTVSYTHLACV